MPARWAAVPDCERPNKWREAMDDEDCAFEKKQKKLERELAKDGKKIRDRNPYKELIPQLQTLDDFLAANGKAAKREKALVVKFYSRQCNACLRIAAKYVRGADVPRTGRGGAVAATRIFRGQVVGLRRG